MTHNTSILAYRKGCMAPLIQLQEPRHNNPDFRESFLSKYQNSDWIKGEKKGWNQLLWPSSLLHFLHIFARMGTENNLTFPNVPLLIPQGRNSKLCHPPPQDGGSHTADASQGPASMRQDRREQPKQMKASWGCSNFSWGARLLGLTNNVFLYYMLRCDWDSN